MLLNRKTNKNIRHFEKNTFTSIQYVYLILLIYSKAQRYKLIIYIGFLSIIWQCARKLFIFLQNSSLVFRFLEVGSWAPGSSKDLAMLLFPPPDRYYQDFHGERLPISVIDYWPFFGFVTAANGSLQPTSGIDHSIVQALAAKLNFTWANMHSLTCI